MIRTRSLRNFERIMSPRLTVHASAAWARTRECSVLARRPPAGPCRLEVFVGPGSSSAAGHRLRIVRQVNILLAREDLMHDCCEFGPA